MLAIEQLSGYLSRLAQIRIEALKAELNRLERVRSARTMTPAQERFWMGGTLAERIERRRARKASLETVIQMLARSRSVSVIP